MGDRSNAPTVDFSEILPEKVETEVKEAALISVGIEISDLDLTNIENLCHQVVSFAEYRAQLHYFLKSRMNTIAPNLTALVGELVGAGLIAPWGSLLNLAKQPRNSVEISLPFRDPKMKHGTPKDGLMYHASLIDEVVEPKNKAGISRSLAAKAVLTIRYDAFGDKKDNKWGLKFRAKLMGRIRSLKQREQIRSAGDAKGKPKFEFSGKDRAKGAGRSVKVEDEILCDKEEENEPKNVEARDKKKRKHSEAGKTEEGEEKLERKMQKLEKKMEKLERKMLKMEKRRKIGEDDES